MTDPAPTTRFLESFHRPANPDRAIGLLSVLRAGHVVAGRDYAVRRQRLQGHDLLYCVQGRGVVEVDGHAHPVGPGQLAWLPGHRPHGHAAEPTDPWTLLWLRLDGAAIEPTWTHLLSGRAPVIDMERGGVLVAWFDRLFDCLRLRSVHGTLVLNALAAELLVMIEADLRGGLDARLPVALARLLPVMAAAPQRPWSEAEMVGVAHVSGAHLRRLFRDHLRTTPRAWLRRERIVLAQDLMARPGARVSTVAEACGFCDVYHFSREFRRAVGQSPTQWRRSEFGA